MDVDAFDLSSSDSLDNVTPAANFDIYDVNDDDAVAEPRHNDDDDDNNDAAVAEPRNEFQIYDDDMDAPPPCLKTSTSLTLTWELMVTKAAHAHQCAAWK